MAFVGITFDLGACVLTEFDDDGHLVAQPDGAGPESRVEPYELHHSFGFAARPQDPELDPDGNIVEGQACDLLIGSSGNDNHAWLSRDPRATVLLPPLPKGSSCQYALTNGRTRSFDWHSGEDGTKSVYVEVGDSAHLLTMGLDGNGKPIVELAHALGQALTMLEKSMVAKNAAGDAYIEWNDAGITGNGNLKWNGAAVFGNPAAAFPLAKFAELAAWCTAIQEHLAAITTLLNGPGAVAGANGALTATLTPTVTTAVTLNSSGASQLLSGA